MPDTLVKCGVLTFPFSFLDFEIQINHWTKAERHR